MSRMISDQVAEALVLGRSFFGVLDIEAVVTLPEECLTGDKHRAIHEAVVKLHKADREINASSVARILNKRPGNRISADDLQKMALDSARLGLQGFEEQLAKVREFAQRRRMVEIAEALAVQAAATDTTVGVGVAGVIEQLNKVADLSDTEDEKVATNAILAQTMERAAELAERRKSGQSVGIPHPLRFFRESCPLQAGDYLALTGNPKGGKTRELCRTIAHALHNWHPVYFASMDTDEDTINRWIACAAFNLDARHYDDGSATIDELYALDEAIAWLKVRPLVIRYDVTQEATAIIARARRWFRKFSGDLTPILAIDHLDNIQLRGGKDQRYDRLGAVSKILRNGFRDLRAAGIVVVQLNRNSYREGRRPGLRDFDGCGQIEQDITAAAFLHRPVVLGKAADFVELYAYGRRVVGNPECKLGYFKGVHTMMEIDDNGEPVDHF